MAKYLAAADFVADQLGCAVVIVHHCGIDATRPRGHTSLTGSVESQLAVKRGEGGEVIVTVEYAKDFAEGTEICSRLEPVTVGTDPDGDDITTLVVPPTAGASPAAKRRRKVKGANKVALDLLRKAIDEAGTVPPASNHVPGQPEISGSRRGAPMHTKEPSRKATSRTTAPQGFCPGRRRSCNRPNLIGIWGDHAWII